MSQLMEYNQAYTIQEVVHGRIPFLSTVKAGRYEPGFEVKEKDFFFKAVIFPLRKRFHP